MPFEGGLDENGDITRDPLKIIQSELSLPAGFWKGSGLSIMLDLLVSLLANGQTSSELEKDEYGNCQVFISVDLNRLVPPGEQASIIERVIKYIKDGKLMSGQKEVRYPGERTLATRKKQLKDGVEVDAKIWNQILGKVNH